MIPPFFWALAQWPLPESLVLHRMREQGVWQRKTMFWQHAALQKSLEPPQYLNSQRRHLDGSRHKKAFSESDHAPHFSLVPYSRRSESPWVATPTHRVSLLESMFFIPFKFLLQTANMHPSITDIEQPLLARRDRVLASGNRILPNITFTCFWIFELLLANRQPLFCTN